MFKKHLTIALADDDADDQFFFEMALMGVSGDIKLRIYNDGVELMQALTASGQPLPDVIFLDQHMPKKDGLTCLEEINAHDALRHIPVVVLNTCMSPANLEKVSKQQRCHYFPKPDNVSQLADLIRWVCTQFRTPSGKGCSVCP
ncbi:response regulator [Paraflavisolibacter sp. H34]|uniref:response regulator n=1 Tax=Huijunlia imazamoxiresistens TaxID=3127457 RepID=UPI00301AFEED